ANGRGRGALLRASWYLRACERGPRVRAGGPVRVANEGTIRIGDRTVFMGGMIATKISCRLGAKIEIGSSSLFNYGVSLEACSSIRIGSRTMFGSLVRVADRSDGTAGAVVIGDVFWICHCDTTALRVTLGSGVWLDDGCV